jgi:thiol-disulfide isomerase/thioredoxin
MSLIMPILLICGTFALAGCDGWQEENKAGAPGKAASATQARGIDRSHAGSPAPDIQFEDPDGEPTSLEAFRGRPVLVNLWATWCAPCVVEMPMLARFQREHRKAGWQVLGLALDNEPAVQKFVTERGIDFPIVLGGADGLQLARTLGNTQGGLPFTVAFDAGGRISATRLGVLDEKTLATWAAKAG